MKTVLFAVALMLSINIFAQDRFYTKNGHIDFYSKAPLEDITAKNKQVAAFLEVNTGKLTFGVLIKSFEFDKALMQEHFNENYLESDEYPKSTFKGELQGFSAENLRVEGDQQFKVSGDLNIHGVTKPISADVTLNVKEGKIKAQSQIIVKPEDYNIKIPKAVRDNIAKEIKINIDITFQPYVR